MLNIYVCRHILCCKLKYVCIPYVNCCYHKMKNKQKEQEETFGGDMWVYSIDSDDGFKGVYLSSE